MICNYQIRIYSGSQSGKVFPIDKAEFSIGRDESCNIVIAENSISRVHLLIYSQETGEAVLVDNNSTNGTTVNNTPINAPVPLSINDVICLGGEVTMVLERFSEAEINRKQNKNIFEMPVGNAPDSFNFENNQGSNMDNNSFPQNGVMNDLPENGGQFQAPQSFGQNPYSQQAGNYGMNSNQQVPDSVSFEKSAQGFSAPGNSGSFGNSNDLLNPYSSMPQQNAFGQDPFAQQNQQNPFSQQMPQQNAFGQDPFAQQNQQNPFSQQMPQQTAFGQDPFAQQNQQNPYGQQMPQQTGFGQDPFAQQNQQNPYGQQMPQQTAFGQDPYGQMQQNPYGQQMPQQTAFGQDPYGQMQQNPYGQQFQQNPYGQMQQNPYGQMYSQQYDPNMGNNSANADQEAAKKKRTILIIIGAVVLLLVLFIVFVDMTYKWCDFFPFLFSEDACAIYPPVQ